MLAYTTEKVFKTKHCKDKLEWLAGSGTLEAEAGGQSGLQSEFQHSQDCFTEKPYLEKQTNKQQHKTNQKLQP